MTPKTKQFAWKDRDTAAQDLLQVAYHAPESIRMRALKLLKAFRSSAIVSHLEQIVLDENWSPRERRYALRAIAAIPGDVYVPQFQTIMSWKSLLQFPDLIELFIKHPGNLEWAFAEIEQYSTPYYVQLLQRSTQYINPGENVNRILCQRLIQVVEKDHRFLTIELVNTFYYRDGSEVMLDWLHERWDTLIYLCLLGSAEEVFALLEDWDALRDAVFRNCPAIIEEYNQEKEKTDTLRLQHKPTFVHYQTSPIWQELKALYEAALEKDWGAYGKLISIVHNEQMNLSKRAVATHLLGKLKETHPVLPYLYRALRHAPDDERFEQIPMNSYIRFEAGEALYEIVLAGVWETFVDAFLTRPHNLLDSFMLDWIEYQTDRLSGIDRPYSGMTLGEVEDRYWFRALAVENSEPKE